MAVSFSGIPNTIRAPFAYIEFDNSRAVQGPSTQNWKALFLGQKTAAGTATALVPVRVTSAKQAVTLFGVGSMLALSLAAWFEANKSTETWVVPQADEGAGVAATGTITVTGPATATGTLALYIAGQVVNVAVTNADSATAMGTAIAAAVNAKTSLPVTAAAVAGVVTLTAKNKGTHGNYIDVRHGYYGESLPSGITVEIVAMASGATDPSVTAALDAAGESQFKIIVLPTTGAANLTAIETELARRWGPMLQIDGHAIAAFTGSYGAASTLGDSRNSPHLSIVALEKSPSLPAEIAAAVAAQVALAGSIDPARPFTTLALPKILPPLVGDRFTADERNLLLYDGISTLTVDSGDVVRIERMITTYKTNGVGADDISYLDLTSVLTLSYLRYDLRNMFLLKYPRHKLGRDGGNYGAGQSIITPKVAKAEIVTKFQQWESLGLVENVDQFKADLVVERNASDPNRLDVLLSPDLINQLLVTAANIQFLL